MRRILAAAVLLALCGCMKQNPILGGWGSTQKNSAYLDDILFTPKRLTWDGGSRHVAYKIDGQTVTLIGKNLPIRICKVVDHDTIKCRVALLGETTLKRKQVNIKEPITVIDLNAATGAELITASEKFKEPRAGGVSLNLKQAECGVQHGWWTLERHNGGIMGDQSVITVQPGQEKLVGFEGRQAAFQGVWNVRYPITREFSRVTQINAASVDPRELAAVDATEAKQIDFTWRWKGKSTALSACGINEGLHEQKGQAFAINIKDDGWNLVGLQNIY